MSRVRGRDTKPELAIRQMVFRLGYRYRLHGKDLPGRPDLVFPGRKKVIFVHGCYWHRHEACSLTSTPKTRKEFWNNKFRENVERDRRNMADLAKGGWSVLTVWQCEINNPDIEERLTNFLEE